MTRLTKALGVALIACLPFAAAAADVCAGVDTGLTPALTTHFEPIVAKVLQARPDAVSILGYLHEGDWTIVNAGSDAVDPGYVFFRQEGGKLRFVDVWGGMTNADDPADIEETADWAVKLGVPTGLAHCFAMATT